MKSHTFLEGINLIFKSKDREISSNKAIYSIMNNDEYCSILQIS